MNCPTCGDRDTSVKETRVWSKVLTRRRRECLGCGRGFASYEVPITVIRTDEVPRYQRGIAERLKALELRLSIAAHPDVSAPKLATMLGTSASNVLYHRRALRGIPRKKK